MSRLSLSFDMLTFGHVVLKGPRTMAGLALFSSSFLSPLLFLEGIWSDSLATRRGNFWK